MKVLDLQCSQGHVFEGWFSSESDFVSQKERALVHCPACGDAVIVKKLSAPRLNLLGRQPSDPSAHPKHQDHTNSADQTAAAASANPQAPTKAGAKTGSELSNPEPQQAIEAADPELTQAWLALARKVVDNTNDVGDKFADEARKMHYGESPARAIRGHTTAQEARLLLDEGIDIIPFPLPEAFRNTLQ